MDAKLKAKWVKALRSKKYKQARGKIRSRNGALCCIGVGFVCKEGISPPTDLMTYKASEAIGLTGEQSDALVNLNDYEEKTFSEIADYIEANL